MKKLETKSFLAAKNFIIAHKTQFCILELIEINLLSKLLISVNGLRNRARLVNLKTKQKNCDIIRCHTPNFLFFPNTKKMKNLYMNNNKMKLVFEMRKICFKLILIAMTSTYYALIVSVRLFKKVLLMSGLMLYMRSGSDNWVITRIHNQLMLYI